VAANDKSQKMDNTMRQEWSRHYDTLLWHVITIFTAGVGALFAYSCSDKTNKLWPEFVGVALSLLGVFYVARFRHYRKRLHFGITNKELRDFLNDPGDSKYLRTWNAFVLPLAVVSSFLIYKLAKKTDSFWVVFLFGLLIALPTFFALWKIGKPQSSGELNSEPQVEEQPKSETLSEQTQAPAPSVAKKKRHIRKRDCLEWVEFGAAMLEVLLTIIITVLIVYELFYAKHQDELASRAPAISFSQNSFSVQSVPLDIREHPIEFVTPEVGIVFNGGHAALLNGNVTAYTDQQDIKITCTENTSMCKTHIEPGYIFPGLDFDLGTTLAVSRGVQIKFNVAYMSNHKPFKVRLKVSGDNIESAKLTDLVLDPTMLPPPPAEK
jgi:hypothetical protein